MNKTALYAMAMLLVPWLSCTNQPVQNLANPPMGTGETGEHDDLEEHDEKEVTHHAPACVSRHNRSPSSSKRHS